MVAVGSLLLAGAGCASRAPESPAARPRVMAEPSSGLTPERIPRARRASTVVVAEPPELLTLPSGGEMLVRPAGTSPQGLLDVPADIAQAGWWRGGAQLGDPFGSTLVAAHVDSRTQGLGPFAELLELPRGARVRLDSDHLSQTFEVRSRRLVPQGSLDREAWLFDVAGQRRLTLVTCAPPYDAARGGYQNLAVVIARPLGPTVARVR